MLKSIFFILIGICLFSCSDEAPGIIDPNPSNPDEPSVEDQGNAEDLYEGMLDLGFKAFFQINSDNPNEENILISPLSLETALYMAANGAQDETLSEMRDALEFGEFYPSGINENFHQLMDKLSEDRTDKTFLNLSQAAFYNPSLFTIDSEFKNKLEQYYIADVYDDKFDLESINGWANEKTEGRIPKVLDQIKADEFMFLMNAIYFLGDWAKPFAEESTRDANFQFLDGRRPTVPMMNQDAALSHYIGDDLKAVDLQFDGGKFAMTFIQTPNPLNEFLIEQPYKDFSDRYIRLVREQLTAERLEVFLPKFEIKYKRELSKDLKAMGMPRAFEEANAQFEKVGNAGGNIFLTRVIHDTFLKIDEKGAEGAAVTTVGFGVESVPPTIVFDRPFLFVLRHIETGIPIFIGKVMDPLS